MPVSVKIFRYAVNVSERIVLICPERHRLLLIVLIATKCCPYKLISTSGQLLSSQYFQKQLNLSKSPIHLFLAAKKLISKAN
jgi:hypothetical protein